MQYIRIRCWEKWHGSEVQSIRISACSRWDSGYTAASWQTSPNRTLFQPAVWDRVVMKSSAWDKRRETSQSRNGGQWALESVHLFWTRHAEQAEEVNKPLGYMFSLTYECSSYFIHNLCVVLLEILHIHHSDWILANSQRVCVGYAMLASCSYAAQWQ